jgi:hypothetical protein
MQDTGWGFQVASFRLQIADLVVLGSNKKI